MYALILIHATHLALKEKKQVNKNAVSTKMDRCTFNDFLSCHSFKNIICRFVSAGCTDDQYNACSMLCECLRVRDGLLKLPDCFSQSDINDIILYLSTS